MADAVGLKETPESQGLASVGIRPMDLSTASTTQREPIIAMDPIVVDFCGQPVPWARTQIRTGAGKPQLFMPQKTRTYHSALRYAAQQAMTGNLLIGPLSMSIVVRIPFLQSWSQIQQKRARNNEVLPTKRPDLDNYEKMVMDALQGVVYVDDSQIVYKISSKIYSERPGVRIEVSQYKMLELEADRASVFGDDPESPLALRRFV